MRIRNVAAAFGAAVLIATPLALANTGAASADEVWFQSVGRASADAKCAPSKAEDLAAGWTEWAPSWGEWANKGKGGWTCDRQITWAFSESTSTVLCGTYINGFESVKFIDSFSLNKGSAIYAGADCAGSPKANKTGVNVVYAPDDDPALAEARCQAAFGKSATKFQGFAPTDTVWNCGV